MAAEGWHTRLRRLMEQRGVVQEDIAHLLGVRGQSAVTGYVTGKRRLKSDQAVAICDYFGVSLDWLLRGEG